jgi:hypothetical protein
LGKNAPEEFCSQSKPLEERPEYFLPTPGRIILFTNDVSIDRFGEVVQRFISKRESKTTIIFATSLTSQPQ